MQRKYLLRKVKYRKEITGRPIKPVLQSILFRTHTVIAFASHTPFEWSAEKNGKHKEGKEEGNWLEGGNSLRPPYFFLRCIPGCLLLWRPRAQCEASKKFDRIRCASRLNGRRRLLLSSSKWFYFYLPLSLSRKRFERGGKGGAGESEKGNCLCSFKLIFLFYLLPPGCPQCRPIFDNLPHIKNLVNIVARCKTAQLVVDVIRGAEKHQQSVFSSLPLVSSFS